MSGLPRLVEKAADVGVSRVNVFNLVVWDESYAEESLIHHREKAREAFALARKAGERTGVTVDLPVVPGGGRESVAAPRSCFDPWGYAYIRQDGTVQACCFSDELAMGDLKEEPFEDIWNGDRYLDLRARVNSDAPPEPCLRCEQRWRLENSEDDAAVYLKLSPRSKASAD